MNVARIGAVVALLCVATSGFAAETSGSVPAASSGEATGGGAQSLEQAANDPTASLMSFQFQNLYSGEYHRRDDEDSYTMLLRSAVPFKAFGASNIARATLPIPIENPADESGLGDLVLFDLVVFDESWGRWGLGPVAQLPTATDEALGSEKWSLGPAIGFVVARPGLLLGAFNQNLFSFAGDDDRDDVEISILQPILNYALPGKWSIGVSEMNVTYSWEEGDFVSLPIGTKLDKLTRIAGVPTQISGSFEYELQDDYVAPEWTLNFTIKVLFPIR